MVDLHAQGTKSDEGQQRDGFITVQVKGRDSDLAPVASGGGESSVKKWAPRLRAADLAGGRSLTPRAAVSAKGGIA